MKQPEIEILERIERRVQVLVALTWLIVRHLKLEERFIMATQETIDRLTADVSANTSAVASAAMALQGLVASVADLTAQLQAAIASGDEAAVKAAADAIEANNAALLAAVPALSQAVVANQAPAADPPASA